jgi:hypothetical protein
VSDRVRQSVAHDAAATTPKEAQEAEAPKAATTRIITEATPKGEDAPAPPAPRAPDASPRPRSRPAPPVEVAAKPEPAKTEPARPEPAKTASPVEKPTGKQSAEKQKEKPAAEPAAPSRDAIAEALAAALSGAPEPTESPEPTSPEPTAPPGAPSGPPLTGAETTGLRRAISQCWNLGSSSTDAMRTTVVVGVTMKPDGSAEAVRLISSDGPNDRATGTAFDAARRAILRCVVNADLPTDKYESWREIEMVFNPDGMRLR